MPVALPDDVHAERLDAGLTAAAVALATGRMLTRFAHRPVAAYANAPRNDDPRLIDPPQMQPKPTVHCATSHAGRRSPASRFRVQHVASPKSKVRSFNHTVTTGIFLRQVFFSASRNELNFNPGAGIRYSGCGKSPAIATRCGGGCARTSADAS
jgi:hypothetical protein